MDIEEIISRYDSYLIQEGVYEKLFDVSDDLVKEIYFKYEYPKFKLQHLSLTDRQFDKLISTQLIELFNSKKILGRIAQR